MVGKLQALVEFSDETRSATMVTSENVDHVRNLLQEDHCTIYREIKGLLGIDMTQIKTILYNYLGVRKLCTRWITHNLMETLKKASKCQMEQRNTQKNMITITPEQCIS